MISFIFGQQREVVWRENRDSGGMFDWTVGVIKENEKYRSFVQTGWGGGAMGPGKVTEEEASQDIERLWHKV
jgi:hypothetical protein